MKVIILCVLLAAVLIQEATSNRRGNPGHRCYKCEAPALCVKNVPEVACGPGEDTCITAFTPVYMGDSPDDIMVWGRGCTTKQKCEKEAAEAKAKAAQAQHSRNIKHIKCCSSNLCNK